MCKPFQSLVSFSLASFGFARYACAFQENSRQAETGN